MTWIAVIGTGTWARVHLAALRHSPYVSGVVLAGRNRDALGKLADEFDIVQQTTTELADIWENECVEIVDVVLPHHLHAQTSLSALQAGKHVICEKPGALQLADFDRMAAVAQSSGRRLLIVMNQLYNPVHQRIRDLVDEGALGRVFLLAETRFGRHDRDYRDPDTWRTRLATAGGGVLIDGGYHMIYKHLYWLADVGQPQWILGDASQLAVGSAGQPVVEQGEDFVCYTIGFDVPLRIASSHAWTLAKDTLRPHQCLLAGTSGSLDVTDDDAPLRLNSANGEQIIEVTSPVGRTGTLEACLLDYIKCLHEDRQPQYGSLTLARQTLQIIQGIYESARTGRRVSLGDA
ncbi:MAG: Gfo/Idh/MocA family oxidoreductase [Pirellulales bacterium]